MINTVIMMGTLARDPELRYTASGSAVANMRLDNTMPYRTKAGVERESKCSVDLTAWSRLAEQCAEYLGAGCLVLVEGRLTTYEWQSHNGPQTRLAINANAIQFLTKKDKATGTTRPAATPVLRQPGEEDVPF